MQTALLHEPVSPEAESTPCGDVVRVLVVDDDPAYQHLCKRYLSRHAKTTYEVVAVANGAAAHEQCKASEFDCILIDYVLPDLMGTQFIDGLELDESKEIPPTIVMTAGSGEIAATEAVRAGATDFLSKSVVSAESLARAIDNAVEKGRLKQAVNKHGRELQVANRKLQSKNDEIQRFYQSVSHEVKTPLAAAREFVALVYDGVAGPVTEEQKEILNHALESCDQISSHFNDLVEMTRLDAAKITMKKKLGSLENVVTRCVASMSSAVQAKDLKLITEIETPLPMLHIDSNRVIQVLSNLLGNAVKYTDPGGQITVDISHRAAEHVVQISVEDSGCGIPEKDLPQIFERLYQVENTGDEFMGAGLGLGLTIAREIVVLHGGEIWATSKQGDGSTFAFTLPVAESIFDVSECYE
ncbi:MAG TPA: hybrid sensor histidine kinase/response regulator [Woeseiaceae bacterium]|nr:hybrid sensor histidine kinase/response regulator [Woeseiaceae bacterium]